MATIPPLAREAIEHARRRDFDKALATAQMALQQDSADGGLQLFVGLLHSRRMEFEKALPHLREAVKLEPTDAASRLELSRALMAVGELDEADRLLAQPGLPMREAQVMRAGIKARQGDLSGAIEGFRKLIEIDPDDFESWGNLGVSLLNGGNAPAAAEALGRSLEIRPDRPRVLDKWAEAHVAANTGEGALARIRSLIEKQPNDPLLWVSAARLEDLLGRPELALEELGRALEVDPTNVSALSALAELYERRNEIDNFADAVKRLEHVAPHAETLPFLRANLALRQGNPEQALTHAESASPITDPGSRAELIGKICDRLGRADEAWDAYSVMNREDGRAVVGAAAEASAYRKELERQLTIMTPAWAKSWTDTPTPAVQPAFLLGFPRSGTTLLDTFLMGHPNVCVSEENRMIQTVTDAEKDLAKLPTLPIDAVEQLRDLYFHEASRYVPGWQGRLLVDKLPFALVAGPHIHRLFPDARIIFVERHPCDVVLSCFFNRFKPTGPGSSFVDLHDTAKLYDGMMRYWTRSCELLPLTVHSVRYERLVEHTEAELRKVADFLGLEWLEALVDNRSTAAKRGFIKTPSYSQVTQPVYRSSVERWRRYRRQFEPVLPWLEPWAERFGYEI